VGTVPGGSSDTIEICRRDTVCRGYTV
jgi:hypothetical protein